MSTPPPRIRAVLLVGGLSSRMGSPKHLLRHPNGDPMYLRALNLLRVALPSAEQLCVSLRCARQKDEFTEAKDSNIRFLMDSPMMKSFQGHEDIGPAAGLLAAHDYDQSAHWLVLACDHPLTTVKALEQLIDAYEEPLTCFDGTDGFCEPLFAIWSPSALCQLRENVIKGFTGPMKVVKALNAKIIKPERPEWIMGANTQEQWASAMRTYESAEGPS